MLRSFYQRARPLARDLMRGEYERTPDGLFIPRHRALLRGVVTIDSKYGVVRTHNRWCASAISTIGFLISAGATTSFAGLYIVPWGSDVTSDAAWEASRIGAFPGATEEYVDEYTLWKYLGELGDGEGYAETTRQAWSFADVGGALLSNSGAPAAFTIATASTINVKGFAIVPNSTKQHGKPYGPWGPGGGLAGLSLVDMSACDTQQVFANAYGYSPPGSTVNGSGTAGNDPYFNTCGLIGNTYALYPAGGEVSPYPAIYDPSYTPSGQLDLVDPSGDDYFDTGSGLWVDPSGDTMVMPNGQIGDLVMALCEFPGGLTSFSNGDPLNITWGVQLE